MHEPYKFCPVCRLDKPEHLFSTIGFPRTRCLACAEKASKAEAKAQQDYQDALARVEEEYYEDRGE